MLQDAVFYPKLFYKWKDNKGVEEKLFCWRRERGQNHQKVFERQLLLAHAESETFFRSALYMKSILFLNEFCIRNFKAFCLSIFFTKTVPHIASTSSNFSAIVYDVYLRKYSLKNPKINNFLPASKMALSKLPNQFCQQLWHKKGRRVVQQNKKQKCKRAVPVTA